ncbi:MAG: hypothetical protein RLZZ393_289 [Pseudomonadota bacterium]|jgi:uncharacterized membrane protein SirB2
MNLAFLPQIRTVHIACVAASGILFLLRGLPLVAGGRPCDHRWLRRLSYAIDTVLLTAAFALMALLHAWPGQQRWLTVKVLLVLVYIALGSLALRRGKGAGFRKACFLAALAVFLFIVGIARRHDPWGWLGLLGPV